MISVTTAVIPIAGYGTRMFPVTKTVSKEMLPLGNRPIIDYVVEDCIAAGITKIMFVVRADQQQIRHFYSQEQHIKTFLDERGASEKYDALEGLPYKATFSFIEQPMDGRYGSAVPLMCAESELTEGHFLYINGDALAWRPKGSVVGELIEHMNASTADGALLATQIPKQDVGQYGVIACDPQKAFTRIVEKPTPQEAPSNLINLGAYVLNQSIFPILESLPCEEESGEYYVTDALESFARTNDMKVYDAQKVHFLDVGTPEKFIASNNLIAQYI